MDTSFGPVQDDVCIEILPFISSTVLKTHACLPFLNVEPACDVARVKRTMRKKLVHESHRCWIDTLIARDDQYLLQACVSSEDFSSWCVVSYIVDNAEGNAPLYQDVNAVIKNLTSQRSRRLFMEGWTKQEWVMWCNTTVARNISKAAFGAGWEHELRLMVSGVDEIEFVGRMLEELGRVEDEERVRHVSAICTLIHCGLSLDVCGMIVEPTRCGVPISILPPYVCEQRVGVEVRECRRRGDWVVEVLKLGGDDVTTSSGDEEEDDDLDGEDDEEEDEEWVASDSESLYYDSSEEICPFAV